MSVVLIIVTIDLKTLAIQVFNTAVLGFLSFLAQITYTARPVDKHNHGRPLDMLVNRLFLYPKIKFKIISGLSQGSG